MKIDRKILCLTLTCLIIFSSCQNNENDDTNEADDATDKQQQGKITEPEVNE